MYTTRNLKIPELNPVTIHIIITLVLLSQNVSCDVPSSYALRDWRIGATSCLSKNVSGWKHLRYIWMETTSL